MYEKALKSIKNHVNRLPMTNDGALQKALHTFGQIESESLTWGEKKKRVKNSGSNNKYCKEKVPIARKPCCTR